MSFSVLPGIAIWFLVVCHYRKGKQSLCLTFSTVERVSLAVAARMWGNCHLATSQEAEGTGRCSQLSFSASQEAEGTGCCSQLSFPFLPFLFRLEQQPHAMASTFREVLPFSVKPLRKCIDRQLRAAVLNLWVSAIGKHIYSVVWGTETLLSSKIAVMKQPWTVMVEGLTQPEELYWSVTALGRLRTTLIEVCFLWLVKLKRKIRHLNWSGY